MREVTWWAYGASLWDDGRLLISPAVFFPCYGYPWPPLPETDVALDIALILGDLSIPDFKDVILVDPAAN